ncbi:unnamed protein product [Prorocentrum cordatum]|uniref:Uncharacterized protein n=1 Tax=Prorocentrum cordatum TaxID=2364126 RepID=A0ABN9SF00_9DINO|nr:unnamed protein product [Polarella glacialis]
MSPVYPEPQISHGTASENAVTEGAEGKKNENAATDPGAMDDSARNKEKDEIFATDPGATDDGDMNRDLVAGAEAATHIAGGVEVRGADVRGKDTGFAAAETDNYYLEVLNLVRIFAAVPGSTPATVIESITEQARFLSRHGAAFGDRERVEQGLGLARAARLLQERVVAAADARS